MSTSRLEKFIYAICSMDVSDLPVPLSRIETLWNCLITGETPNFEPLSRNEKYLMAMLDCYDISNLPAPMSRGEKLLYKIAVGETDLSDVPAYLSRYEELLKYLIENGGIGGGDFEYILHTLNQRLSTLYLTSERPMKQAVIKGDTLVNELPKPSLKNTMTNAASQKLNHGYDNGKTLVNLISNGNVKQEIGRSISTKATYVFDKTMAETNNECLLLFNVSEYLKDYAFYISFNKANESGITYITGRNNGIVKVKVDFNKVKSGTTSGILANELIIFHTNSSDDPIGSVNDVILIPYQEGMENWDIPYFEGTKTFGATPNVVDGEFKQAVVKGQTLVNLLKTEKNSDYVLVTNYWVVEDDYFKLVAPSVDTSYQWCTIQHRNGSMLQPNSKYLLVFDVKENSCNGTYNLGFDGYGSTLSHEGQIVSFNDGEIGIKKTIVTTSTTIDVTKGLFRAPINLPNGGKLTFRVMAIPYQEGMENWDIPYFEGMQSVQLSEVTTTGKNLFDENKETETEYIGANGTWVTNSGLQYINQTYKISNQTHISISYSEKTSIPYVRLAEFRKNGTFIKRTLIDVNNTIITLDEETDYIIYSVDKNSAYFKNLQIEFSSVATPYEPYKSNTLTLADPVNLRKVGDVEDEFDALTSQVTERVGGIVLDGSENWSINQYSSNNNVITFTGRILSDAKVVSNIITYSVDKLASLPNGLWASDEFEGFLLMNNKQLTIKIKRETASTPEELSTYLLNSPITVQYQLATESTKTVSTTITNQDGATQTKLHSFNDGHLSVSSQGLLPSAVNYEVPTNNSYYLPDMLTLGAQYTSRGSAACNATIDGKLFALGTNKTFTTPSSVTNRLMVLDAPVDDLMFIKGDQTAKDFGYFEGMKSVELSNKMPVLTTTGKNLFNFNDLELGRLNNNGEPTTSNTARRNKNFIDVSHIDKFTLSMPNYVKSDGARYVIIYCYDSNKKYLGYIPLGDNFDVYPNRTFLNNTKFIKISIDQYVVNPSDVFDVQLEKGAIATPYEPFKSNILMVNEPVELRGIGDVKDTLDFATGEVTQRVGEYVITGEESWGNTSSAGGYFAMVFNDNQNLNRREKGKIQCNKLKVLNNATISDEYIYGGIGVYMSFSRTRVADRTAFINHLKGEFANGTPYVIQYELATPVIKTVDLTTLDQDGQPTKLKTFDNITHVEIGSNEIVPSVDVEVATNLLEDSVFNLSDAFSTLYPTAAKPVKSAILKGQTLVNLVTQKNGSFNGTRFLRIPLNRTLKTSTKHFVKFNLRESSLTGGVACRLRIGTSGSVVGNLISDGIITVTDDGYNYIEFYIRNADDVTNGLDAIVDDIMVIEYQDGMENWDIPYFTGMQSVKMPVLTTTGKNLFDGELEKGSINSNTGGLITTDSAVRSKKYTFLQKGQYRISKTNGSNFISLFIYNKDLTFTKPQTLGMSSTLVIQDDCYVKFVDTLADLDNKYQIEQGTQVTPFEEHKTNILNTSEDVVLSGIGDVRDELNLLTGELNQRIGKIVLDGSSDEDWYIAHGGSDTHTRFVMRRGSNLKPINNVNRQAFLCSKFKCVSTISGTNSDEMCLMETFDNYFISIIIDNTKLNSVDVNGLRLWLQSNPVEFNYVIQDESIKTVDLTVVDQDGKATTLKTFDDTTHVLLESEAGPIPTATLTVRTKIPTASSTRLRMDDILVQQQELNEMVNEQSDNIDGALMGITEIYEEIL